MKDTAPAKGHVKLSWISPENSGRSIEENLIIDFS